VSEKLPLLIGDGEAFTVAPEVIVSGSMPGVELVNSDPLTDAPLNPNRVSRTCVAAWSSATTPALYR
jgi:hypothetical protein